MAVESSAEEVFLAERIVDSGFGQQDGKRYYKVKWVRYTWELEESISHVKELIDLFWNENGGVPNYKTPNKNENATAAASATTATKPTNAQTQLDSEELPVSSSPNGSENPDETVVREKNEDEISAMETDATSKKEQTEGSQKAADNSAMKTLKPLTCEICFRVYSTAQSLKSHKRVHTQEKPYKCEKCEKCFGEKSTLKRHMYIHLENKPFKCEVCERGFSDKSTLRRHVVTHSGAKRFQCDLCMKRFTRNEHLRQHMFIHTAEKLYKCDVCFKTFRQRSTLKNHTLIHRAENNFKCDTCNAVFSVSELYEKHILWCNENNGISLKCNLCNKRFPDKDQLADHISAHKDQIFQCEQCSRTFINEADREKHALTHSPKKPYNCAVCGKLFLEKVSLVSHVSTQHPDQSLYELMTSVDYDLNEEMSLGGFGAQPSESGEISAGISNVDCDTLTQNPVGVPSYNEAELSVAGLAKPSLEGAGKSDENEIITPRVSGKDSSFLDSTSKAESTIPSLNIGSLDSMVRNASQVISDSNSTDLLANSTQSLLIDNSTDILSHNTPNAQLRLNLPETGELQPGENQLVQVQIIQMQDGNQFVQSIRTIVPENATEYNHSELIVDDTQVMALSEESNISSVEKADNLVSTELLTPNVNVDTANNLIEDESQSTVENNPKNSL